jgi:hypothetical protein
MTKDVDVTTTKPREGLLDIGTEVKIIAPASSHHGTKGVIVGYDPTEFWVYRVRHHDGHNWWRLAHEVTTRGLV